MRATSVFSPNFCIAWSTRVPTVTSGFLMNGCLTSMRSPKYAASFPSIIFFFISPAFPDASTSFGGSWTPHLLLSHFPIFGFTQQHCNINAFLEIILCNWSVLRTTRLLLYSRDAPQQLLSVRSAAAMSALCQAPARRRFLQAFCTGSDAVWSRRDLVSINHDVVAQNFNPIPACRQAVYFSNPMLKYENFILGTRLEFV